jgi:hypothetical protein
MNPEEAYRDYVQAQINGAKTLESKKAWIDLWLSQPELEGYEVTLLRPPLALGDAVESK